MIVLFKPHIDGEAQSGQNFVITTQDSPLAIVFQSTPISSGTGSYFPFSGPAYYDLGVGHNLVAAFQDPANISGTIVTYPEENSIRLITR